MPSFINFLFSSSGTIKINCWFCQVDNDVPRDQENCWFCSSCGQYNGFDEKTGDYNINVPGMADEAMNPIKYPCDSIQDDDTKWDNGLCLPCNQKQRAIIRILKDFETTTDDTHDKEYSLFVRNLDNTYRLCAKCEIHVGNVLSRKSRQLWTQKETRLPEKTVDSSTGKSNNLLLKLLGWTKEEPIVTPKDLKKINSGMSDLSIIGDDDDDCENDSARDLTPTSYSEDCRSTTTARSSILRPARFHPSSSSSPRTFFWSQSFGVFSSPYQKSQLFHQQQQIHIGQLNGRVNKFSNQFNKWTPFNLTPPASRDGSVVTSSTPERKTITQQRKKKPSDSYGHQGFEHGHQISTIRNFLWSFVTCLFLFLFCYVTKVTMDHVNHSTGGTVQEHMTLQQTTTSLQTYIISK